MPISRATFLVLCLLCAGLIAACGDDDDPGGGSSAESFIADADEICTETARAGAAAQAPTPTTAEEAVPVLEDSLERREKALSDLEALGDPPAEIADEWEQFLAKQKLRTENTARLIELAEQGVAATSPRYQEVVVESEEADAAQNEILGAVGSTACAEVLPPAEREEIIEMVTTFETEALDDCTEYTTDNGIEFLFGSLRQCQEAQENPPPEGFTKQVNVTSIEGVAGVAAEVDASLKGGIGDGQDVTYNIVYEDGRYKVDEVTAQAG